MGARCTCAYPSPCPLPRGERGKVSEDTSMRIRKMLTVIEEIHEDGGRPAARPLRKVAAVAVIENPFAGRYVEDLQELVKTGEELGELLGKRAVAALGAPVHSYGKAAIVGEHGEYEHAAAILHPTLGTPFRAAVGGGKAIIPSAKKLGSPGASIDVPLHFKDAAFVVRHAGEVAGSYPHSIVREDTISGSLLEQRDLGRAQRDWQIRRKLRSDAEAFRGEL